jgi:uncharacterized protein (DUF4415 family)
VPTVTFGDFEWDADKATANATRHGVAFEEAVNESSVRGVRPVVSARPMNEDEKLTEPSEESLREIPEQDFSRAIRPNRYANLRGAFQHAVFVDRDIWEHFRSGERINEVLRLLVDIAKKRSA